MSIATGSVRNLRDKNKTRIRREDEFKGRVQKRPCHFWTAGQIRFIKVRSRRRSRHHISVKRTRPAKCKECVNTVNKVVAYNEIQTYCAGINRILGTCRMSCTHQHAEYFKLNIYKMNGRNSFRVRESLDLFNIGCI